MQIRPYRSSDLPALTALFYDTVHRVNARDYTPRQLDAWASGSVDAAGWDRSLLAHVSLVALLEGQPVGFADLDPASGLLDRLYVHAEHQGQGIATALCNRLEPLASGSIVTTHASITARPFFEKRGYRLLRAQQVERRGVLLPNFVMEKRVRQDP